MGRAVLGMVLVLALAGCSGDTDEAASSATTTTASASREEASYLQAIRSGLDVEDVSDQALLATGEETCAALDRGVSPLEVLGTLTEENADAGAVFLGVSATTLCRDHAAAVQELANTVP